MSALTDKQAKFARMFGALLVYASAVSDEYQVRLGDAYRDKKYNKSVGGHPRSLHTSRLAVDLIVDRNINGKWVLQKKRCWFHGVLHEYWDSIGGAEEIPGDSGHFSLAHRGMR